MKHLGETKERAEFVNPALIDKAICRNASLVSLVKPSVKPMYHMSNEKS